MLHVLSKLCVLWITTVWDIPAIVSVQSALALGLDVPRSLLENAVTATLQDTFIAEQIVQKCTGLFAMSDWDTFSGWKIYCFFWVKDKSWGWNSETELPAFLQLAGSRGHCSAAALLRRVSPQIPPPQALGITHSLLMSSAYWHKFFSAHSVAFDYLKIYHNQTAFKVLSPFLSHAEICCSLLHHFYFHPPKFFLTPLLNSVSRLMI